MSQGIHWQYAVPKEGTSHPIRLLLKRILPRFRYKAAPFEKSPLYGALDKRTSAENAYKTELWLARSFVSDSGGLSVPRDILPFPEEAALTSGNECVLVSIRVSVGVSLEASPQPTESSYVILWSNTRCLERLLTQGAELRASEAWRAQDKGGTQE